jgi:hypothetical protein
MRNSQTHAFGEIEPVGKKIPDYCTSLTVSVNNATFFFSSPFAIHLDPTLASNCGNAIFVYLLHFIYLFIFG